MTEPLVLLPNAVALTSAFLRDQDEVTDLVDDEVKTAFGKGQTFPAVKLELIGDELVTKAPRWFTASTIQVSAFGGPKALAWKIAETCRAVLVDRFVGSFTYSEDVTGVVSVCRAQGLRDEPDATYTPARPRWLFLATVYAHPLV